MSRLPSYDIFISYRREGADATARLLYERLLRDGYRVAFDLETLRSGDFDEQILDAIRECRDVIVVLAPGSLERCRNPGDWVRLEIACALESGKNVIPLMLRGFSFPPADELPPEIRRLPRKQGISASMEHLDSSIDRLKGFLTAKPTLLSHRRAIGWIANAAVLACIAAILALVWPRDRGTAPPARPGWIPGTWDDDVHRHARRGTNRFEWIPLPGWRVVRDFPRPEFEWYEGASHGRIPHIHTTPAFNRDESGDWDPDPGYEWVDFDRPRADSRHPASRYEHHPNPSWGASLVRYRDTDMWIPARHHAWRTSDPGDLSTSNNWNVVWHPGWTPSPGSPIRAGVREGEWMLDPGYVRLYPDLPAVVEKDLAVRWVPGTLHPRFPHVHAADAPGEWLPDPGFRFDPDRGGYEVLPDSAPVARTNAPP